MLTRTEARLPILKGKLQVSRWAREYVTHPKTFPVAFDQLTATTLLARDGARRANPGRRHE
jgi:5-methylcytosine-specific restriction endonuclease McrBC regulatory subunit McrC